MTTGLCHVLTVFIFAKPVSILDVSYAGAKSTQAKHAYRSIAAFVQRVTSQEVDGTSTQGTQETNASEKAGGKRGLESESTPSKDPVDSSPIAATPSVCCLPSSSSIT
jgi:hypothetical protein